MKWAGLLSKFESGARNDRCPREQLDRLIEGF